MGLRDKEITPQWRGRPECDGPVQEALAKVDEKATFRHGPRLTGMKSRMVWWEISVLSLTVAYAAVVAQSPGTLAQPDPANAQGASPLAARTELNQAILEWTPPGLSQLSGLAVAKESFTLDKTILAAAAGLMPILMPICGRLSPSWMA